MKSYKFAQRVLAQEPETRLAYLYGHKLTEFPHLLQRAPRAKGAVLQVFSFFIHVFSRLSIRDSWGKTSEITFLFFARTINQKSALSATLAALQAKGKSVSGLGPREFAAESVEGNPYRPIKFLMGDVVNAVLLLCRRGIALHRTVKAIEPRAVSWHLSKFYLTYIYLCYFHRVLDRARPRYVVVSNDHNLANRCLLAVAHRLSVNTVYLQHASVSDKFPPLRMNIAFLDGMHALETYRQCEGNATESDASLPLPLVYLSGQKKPINGRPKHERPRVVGIATNSLDTADAVVQLVNYLTSAGALVYLRWHPAQSKVDIDEYNAAFHGVDEVRLSNPEIQPVAEFLTQVGWLIAGNSSIHLEAALAGVEPIYYETSPVTIADYYGYVKNGLARNANSAEELIGIIRKSTSEFPSRSSIQYYSSTYATEWEAREGELTAECLLAHSLGRTAPLVQVSLKV